MSISISISISNTNIDVVFENIEIADIAENTVVRRYKSA